MRSDRSSEQAITGVERQLWSVPLPEVGVHAITVTATGTVLVSLTSVLVAVRGQRVAWTAPAAPFGRTVSLGDGRFGAVESGHLQIRRESDGSLLTDVADAGPVVPVVFAGRLALRPREPGTPAVVAVDATGRTSWRIELDEVSSEPPAVVGDLLALRDGRRLRFVDSDGAEVWRYEPEGDRHPVGPVRGFGADRALVQTASPEGNGLLVLDPATRSASALPVHLPTARPVAITAGRLATADWDVRDADQPPVPALLVVDLGSGSVRRLVLPAPLVSVVGSPGGSFGWAASPNLERWQAYQPFAGMDDSPRCAVGVLPAPPGPPAVSSAGPAGWWAAPGPILGPLAVAEGGVVLVPLPGELVALG